jgi:hypothetical protein
MSTRDLGADIEAVRAALLRLRDNDHELLGIDWTTGDQEEIDTLRRNHLPVRRTLVSELVDFLDAREDIVDLQVRTDWTLWNCSTATIWIGDSRRVTGRRGRRGWTTGRRSS